jgi:glutamyl-tRNA reductase
VLLCLSSNHANASFELLEKLSIGAPGAAVGLVAASDFVTGVVVLATCNRFEAYLDIDEPLTAATAVAVASTIAALSEASGVDPHELRRSLTVHEGDDVARHLFAVSSGLESVVVGEDEISGQVQRALDTARLRSTTSRDLERLFQKATHTSRGVKNKTALGGSERSLVRLALELASSRIADWSAAKVLVVGTGRYAATTVTALRARGATDIQVFSHSGRAGAFAAKYGLAPQTTIDTDVDVIVTCTASAVLAPTAFAGDRARIVIDLGLPRNVDVAVARVPGVELLDLETIRLHAPLEDAHGDAAALVREAAVEFAASTAAEPGIVALRTHIFAALEAEVARAKARGAGNETESALRHLVGVLLHEPSMRARELAAEGRTAEFVAGLRTLYGLEVEAPLRAVRDDTA